MSEKTATLLRTYILHGVDPHLPWIFESGKAPYQVKPASSNKRKRQDTFPSPVKKCGRISVTGVTDKTTFKKCVRVVLTEKK